VLFSSGAREASPDLKYNSRTMDITILIHTQYKGRKAVEDAVSEVNRLQADFKLHIDQADWLHNGVKKVDPRQVMDRVKKKNIAQPLVVVIQTPLKGDWFDYSARGIHITSTARWERDFGPPPLKVFIAFQIACAVSMFVADLPSKQSRRMAHRRVRGCVFDLTSGRREFRLDLFAAQLCAECEGLLSEWGVSDRQLASIEEILAYVRDFVIRKPRSTPSSVFIGHGRHKDWEKIRDHLVTLGLPVEEFNAVPTAGITTVQRLTQMLNKACLAILVMTAEDAQFDGKKNARQNVVHEIGLFQGRLGFEKSIIVKQQGATEFSNIGGLTYIPYKKGRIEESFRDIENVLVRERVIESVLTLPLSKTKPIARRAHSTLKKPTR
jgi:predicted nucleotide-binding protein